MITGEVRSAAFANGWKLDRFRPDGRTLIERDDLQIIVRKSAAARAYRGNALTAILRNAAQLANYLRTT